MPTTVILIRSSHNSSELNKMEETKWKINQMTLIGNKTAYHKLKPTGGPMSVEK